MKNSYALVLVSAPKEAAEKIARRVLKERVAACVNILSGAQSLYWWKGKIANSEEALLLMKTRMKLLPLLESVVKAVHPYDVSEIVALPITRGDSAYLNWISKETRAKS